MIKAQTRARLQPPVLAIGFVAARYHPAERKEAEAQLTQYREQLEALVAARTHE